MPPHDVRWRSNLADGGEKSFPLNFLINKVSIRIPHPPTTQQICLSLSPHPPTSFVMRARLFTVNYFFSVFGQISTSAVCLSFDTRNIKKEEKASSITLQLLIIVSLITGTRLFESSVHGKYYDRKRLHGWDAKVGNRSATCKGLSQAVLHIDKTVSLLSFGYWMEISLFERSSK